MTEAQVIANFKKLMKSWLPGAVVEKINQGPYSSRGIPDLLVMAAGITALLEVKSKTGRLTAIQEQMLNQMSKAGGPVGLLRGTDEPYTFEIMDYKTGYSFVISKQEGKDVVVRKLQEFLHDRRINPGDSV